MNSITGPCRHLAFSADGTNLGGRNNELKAEVKSTRENSEAIAKPVKTSSDKFDLKQIFGDEASGELKALGFNEEQTEVLLESLTQGVNLEDSIPDTVYSEYCMAYLQNLPEIFRKVESGDLEQDFLFKFFNSGADITCTPFAEDPEKHFEENSKLSLYVLAKFITHLNSSSLPLEQRNKYLNYLEAVLGQGLTNLQQTGDWINIGQALQRLNPDSSPALNYLHGIVVPKSELKNQLLENAKGFYDSQKPEPAFDLKSYVQNVQDRLAKSTDKNDSKSINYSDILDLASSKSRVLVVHDIHHDQYYFSNSTDTDLVSRNFRPKLSFYTKAFNKLIEDFISQGFTQIQIHPSAICPSGAAWREEDTIETINAFLKSDESSPFTSHLLKFKQSVAEIPRSLAEFASLVEDLKGISNETGAHIEVLDWTPKTEQQNKDSKTLSILGSRDIIFGDQSDTVLIDFSTHRGAGHSLSLGQPNLREVCSEAMHCFFNLRNNDIRPNALYALSFSEDFQKFLNDVAPSPNKTPDFLISFTRPQST